MSHLLTRLCTPTLWAATTLLSMASPLAIAQAAPNAGAASTDERYIWDLTPLFATPAAWEAEHQAVLAELPKLQALKGTVAKGSASALWVASEANFNLLQRIRRLELYASMQLSSDNRDPEFQNRSDLLTALYGQVAEASAWLEPEVQRLGSKKVEAMLAAEPRLRPYAVSLRDTIRRARHTLSADAEAALGAVSPTLTAPSQAGNLLLETEIPWSSMVSEGQSLEVNPSSFVGLREQPDRSKREQAYKAFFGQLGRYEGTLGSLLSSSMQLNTIDARLRQHNNAISANLSTHQIPEAVVRTLVAQANAGLPVLHRYFKLRQRMLGLPDLHYHDVYPALVSLDRQYSPEESARLTIEATQVLGPDYQRHLQAALKARSMHVFPAPGKSSGAFATGFYRMTPYVLLNHLGSYDSLTTFAHEWGHAIHNMLADEAQAPQTASYPTFTAEVASTTNEILLSELLIAQAKTREEKLFYLGQGLEQLRGTFFRQTMFAEFELAAHDALERGEALGGKKLTALYCGLLRKYHGADQGVMAIDPAYCTEWAYIPHFFNAFYVYQYATSITAASYFAPELLKGQPGLRDKYLGVLRAGGAKPPYELLRDAGVDLASPAPYQALLARMNATMDEMYRLLTP